MHDALQQMTGSLYGYDYQQLRIDATVGQIRSYIQDIRRLFAPIAQRFDDATNSLWVLRHYLAIKFVMAGALLGGSARYSEACNLRLAVPYFNYYTVLNAARAFLLTSPDVEWRGRETLEMRHSTIVNRTAEGLHRLDSARFATWKETLHQLRDHRELFSYRFPLGGDGHLNAPTLDTSSAIALARLLAELASLNSECLDGALRRHTDMTFHVVSIPDERWAREYALTSKRHVDRDDQERFGKLRSWGTVSPLHVMTSDGYMEDLFGAWTDPLERPDVFNPDDYDGLLLNF